MKDSLIQFLRESKKVCPKPDLWQKLWETLPGKQRKGSGWNPPLPLILAAWHDTTDDEKRNRLLVHIEYADEKGVLEKVDDYLRTLTDDQWVYEGKLKT